MPSFQDSVVLFILALVLFGPKKLPALAREIGKWLAEFRRASNEFKYQMQEELRLAEQAEQAAKATAIESSSHSVAAADAPAQPAFPPGTARAPEPEPLAAPEPIAVAQEFKIMPPSTGLPAEHSGSVNSLITAIPAEPAPHASTEEPAAHD